MSGQEQAVYAKENPLFSLAPIGFLVAFKGPASRAWGSGAAAVTGFPRFPGPGAEESSTNPRLSWPPHAVRALPSQSERPLLPLLGHPGPHSRVPPSPPQHPPDRGGPATATARDQRGPGRRAPRAGRRRVRSRERAKPGQEHAGSCSSCPTGPKEAGKGESSARLRAARLPPGHSRTAALRREGEEQLWQQDPAPRAIIHSAPPSNIHATQEVKFKQFYSTENMKVWNKINCF